MRIVVLHHGARTSAIVSLNNVEVIVDLKFVHGKYLTGKMAFASLFF
jgi:hypothetical protein